MVRKLSAAVIPLPPGYAIDPASPPMLRYQASVPKLPVPTLESTCAKYLETVQPLLTPEAYAKTKSSVSTFLASPLAAELQSRLKDRAAQPETLNWLSDWWNEVAYMGYRDPVVVYVSYFYVHVNDPARTDPAARAASLIKAMLPFRELTERYVLYIPFLFIFKILIFNFTFFFLSIVADLSRKKSEEPPSAWIPISGYSTLHDTP